MKFRRRSDGHIFQSLTMVRREYPNTVFPKAPTDSLLESLDLDRIYETPRPELTLAQTAIQDGYEQVGDRWQTKWVIIDPTQEQLDAAIDNLKAQKLAKFASDRYDKEVAGVEFGEYRLMTDREDTARLNETANALEKGWITETQFKCHDNKWITLTADNIDAVAIAIAQHLKACFDEERIQQETLALLTDPAAIQEM